MANVFKKDEVAQEKSVIEIVRDSLDVDGEGTVRFRSRVGRGSGKAVEIPGSQFDEFVTLMVQAQESREALAQQQAQLDAGAPTTTTATGTSGSDDSDSSDDDE